MLVEDYLEQNENNNTNIIFHFKDNQELNTQKETTYNLLDLLELAFAKIIKIEIFNNTRHIYIDINKIRTQIRRK